MALALAGSVGAGLGLVNAVFISWFRLPTLIVTLGTASLFRGFLLAFIGTAIVNELPKYRFMSGGELSVPVALRVISGAGGRFGTQHSASGESWFMGQPGLRVAASGTPAAAWRS